MVDEWEELRQTVQSVAEAFAATDPPNAWQYRQEAADFCAQRAPESEDSLVAREREAEALRQRWKERISGRDTS